MTKEENRAVQSNMEAIEMEVLYGTCGGVDVHKKLLVVCLRSGRKSEVRNFGTTTQELFDVANWLKDNHCEMVAMESTASYWKPLYNVLEVVEIPTMVVNAQHMKAVPGRKTDVKDAEWIADLCQHGLLKASYIPDKDQRELRELVRYRKSLIEDQGREVNRLQKMLEGANIKLSGTIKDINGMSGRCLIEKIVNGEKIDEKVYDELYESKAIAHNLKASKEQIIADLNGVLSDLQRKMMKELIAHLDELEKHIKNLDDEIDNFMKPDEKTTSKLIQDIPGIGNTSAQAIISVIGTDMSRFPTDRHISKWAGLCPGNNESAGKRKSGKTAKGNKVLRTTLITCAHAAVKVKNSFFNAQFTRISAHRGAKRAYVAVAHSMLIAIYHVLSTGELFKDLGNDYYNQFNKERKANSMVKRLKALGYEVTIAAVPELA